MQCGDCNSKKVLLDNILGEYYCRDCGLILEDTLVDFGDLSFAFGENGELRSHSPTNFIDPDRGLGTSLKHAARKITRRLKMNYLNRPEGLERNFHEAVPILRSAWNILALPQDLRIHSAMLYRRSLRKHITSGRKTEIMVLAAIHSVCSAADFQENITEAVKTLKVPIEEVYNCSKMVEEATRTSTPRHHVKDYVNGGIGSLQLTNSVCRDADDLTNKILHKKFEIGKHPRVVAGAIIYTVCSNNDVDVSQSKIAKTLKISERSIRRVAAELTRTV